MTNSIIMFLGGIALFIYGITTLSDHLKKASGNKFKSLIDKVVNNPIFAVLIGILITAITSSSSAIIILIIGLVRAGFINSKQSVGLIIGANIGSTFSAFIISLPVGDYSYAILVVGIILMFIKDKKVKNIGGIILSLGLLFLGLNIMGDGFKPLIQTSFATNLFYTFSKTNFLGTAAAFIFGTVFTAIIQSSSAVSAIIQKLYSLNTISQTISLRGALPMIIGANIGTTITGLIASIGGNTESKRTALIHVIFNVVAAIIFLVGIHPYYLLVQTIETMFLPQYSMVTIAVAHLIQNIITAIVLLFFINQVVKVVEFLVPYSGIKSEDLVFDEKLIKQSPLIALEFSKKAIIKLNETVYEYFILTKNYAFTNNNKAVEEANTFEMIIDELDGKIHNYLIKIIRQGVVSKDTNSLTQLLEITKDLERIGDHLSNVIQFFNIRYNEKHKLSKSGTKDLREIFSVIDNMFNLISESIYSDFDTLPYDVLALEDIVDKLEAKSRSRYVERLKKGEFDFYQTSNYSDILSDLERIADHLNNIANVIIEPLPTTIAITGLDKT